MQISQSIFGNDALVSIKLSICELDNIFYNKFLNSGNKPFHCFIIRLGLSYPQWWHFQFTIFSDWGSKLVGSSPTFFQNPSLSSNPGRPSQNLFSQRRLTEESRCPSNHLEMLEGGPLLPLPFQKGNSRAHPVSYSYQSWFCDTHRHQFRCWWYASVEDFG